VLEPQGEVIRALQEGVVITAVEYHAARDTRLHVSVDGMPYTERYCFRPAEIPRPEVHGTLPARVESREKNDIYALDGHGRYRVRLDFDRDDTEQGFACGCGWRSRTPETYGWHAAHRRHRSGHCVQHGDIDLPYISHALHDAEHPDHVTRDNHTRNVLRTREQQAADGGPARRRISSSPRSSENPAERRASGGCAGKARGKGFELRTDEHGVIRVAKGCLSPRTGNRRRRVRCWIWRPP
jgi:type VI secretion system secreted protein VgrG